MSKLYDNFVNLKDSNKDKMNIDFELIDSNSKKIENSSEYISNLNFNSIIDKLVKIDFDNITCKDAFDILYDLSLENKKILDAKS